MNRWILPLMCGAVSLAGTAAAVAQTADGSATPQPQQAQNGQPERLEEVTVTARRRGESLQSVPVSVDVVTPEQLRNNDATDLAKLAELAPQVMVGRATVGTGGVLTIRGISSSATDAGLDQSVTVVVDGVPLSRGRIVTASLYDMQQVEVMEGPQALFFGKNSPAGVISLTTNDPTDTFGGYFTGGYEFVAAERFGEGAISGPIADNLTARLSFRGDYMDGWIKNNALPVADPLHPGVTLPGATMGNDGPAGYDLSARLSMLWTPSADFDAKLKLTWDKERLNAMDAFNEEYCSPMSAAVPVEINPFTKIAIPKPGADCDANGSKSESADALKYAVNYPYANNGEPYGDSRFFLGSLTLDKRLDALTLVSTTGIYDQVYDGSDSADYSPFTEIFDSQYEHYQLFTEELRGNTEFSGPVNFMGGVYFEHSIRPNLNAPDLYHLGLNPVAQNYATVETWVDNRSDSVSAFGQARWNILPNLELAAGARYSHDTKDANYDNIAINPFNFYKFFPLNKVLPVSYTGNNVSPEATITWHITPDQTLYAAYKTGYKAGGMSGATLFLSSTTPQGLKFGAENTYGQEIGYKADLLNHTLRWDTTAYLYNYNGLQVATFDAATISFNIGNAASARTEGVETSFEWLATDHLSFKGNLGYNDAYYLKFNNAQCYAGQTAAQGCLPDPANPAVTAQSLSGKRLNRAPLFTYDLGVEYNTEIFSTWTADFSIDGDYTGSYEAQADYDPGALQKAFWRLNAALHVGPDDGQYDISLIGRDLTNSYYLINSSSMPGGTANEFIGTFDRPREVILQIALHY